MYQIDHYAIAFFPRQLIYVDYLSEMIKTNMTLAVYTSILI